MEKKSRKQEILDAALACFTENGIEATTIDMIRERSGASVGSLYHHFGSKDAIAAAVYIAALDEHGDLQRRHLSGVGSAEDAVKALVHAYVDWIAANPDKARFVLYSRGVVSRGESAADLAAHSKARVSEIKAWFRKYIEEGSVRDWPLECYGSLITGPAHDYARLWLSGRAKTDIKAYREIFADAAWNAVRSA
ncbi:TetR/AcrR family transcriptional regulator [Noviherbaspirillum galbum]|uniref:TetR/AcrR family transcriptional regulator n=1 Tax=Noviherbaspirillum galbum TaxID=2709383 RepID=A0A6B3SR16_9BURK|nr:TetR/AcrR family transcriptional regulator [Noviherbaspirillum galbum]NEX61206.1 TetR/AcrR family transcriptional regulator [Noviherbaspirillum galbum]